MPANDLDLLTSAAEEAAKIANRFWRSGQIVTEKPGGAGPVSEGDLAVDAYLRETLTAARPGYGWLSEETEDSPARLSSERVFIVDPIDGTRAYVDGQSTWALSLAVVEHGQTVAGVVLLPQRGKLYRAAAGAPATLNGAPIHASAATRPDGAAALAPKASLAPEKWPGGLPPLARHFRPSLAYRLCLVAEGRFDAMLTLRPTWDWDIAAGTLIAQQAGVATADPSGAALRFNGPGAANTGALAAPPELLADLLARLTPAQGAAAPAPAPDAATG